MALKFIADSTASVEPTTLMMAGMMLYSKGYKDSSIYWTYLGDIRLAFLASLYKDPSARALYPSMHSIALQITKDYAKDSMQTLYKKIDQALNYDSLNPLKAAEFLENPTDTLKYIPTEKWHQQYNNIRQAYRHFEEDILQKGNSIFEDGEESKKK
jgi:hypothetical protein